MDESGEPEGGGEWLLVPGPASTPPAVGDEDTSGEVDANEYGPITERADGASKPLLEVLHTKGRPRWSSFARSLSPTISPDSATASMGHDFPLSIDRPPPPDILDELYVA
jgi:hypothetical protein